MCRWLATLHYNGHWLLTEYPACAEALDKYRINPGNVGFREKRDTQFQTMIEVALTHDRPVRIGVNWGSLDQDLLAALMVENAARPEPKDAQGVMREALVESGLRSAALTEQIGLARDKIVISAKVSQVQDLIAVYGELGARGPRRPRHAGRRSAAGGGETRSETTHRRARRRDLLPALRLAGLGHRVGGTRAHGGWRRRRFGRRREPMARRARGERARGRLVAPPSRTHARRLGLSVPQRFLPRRRRHRGRGDGAAPGRRRSLPRAGSARRALLVSLSRYDHASNQAL